MLKRPCQRAVPNGPQKFNQTAFIQIFGEFPQTWCVDGSTWLRSIYYIGARQRTMKLR
jgi:hypothetical protein